MNSEFDVIKKRWSAFESRPFPKECDERFDLFEIDTFSAGCISVFVENGGNLDRERIDVLRKCLRELDPLLFSLAGRTKDYFAELAKISNSVLRLVELTL